MMSVDCPESPVLAGSTFLAVLGVCFLYGSRPSPYGKYAESPTPAAFLLPARVAWFLQYLPAFAVTAGILAQQPISLLGQPATILLGLFCAHYFHRTFVYSLFTRGRPVPVQIVIKSIFFCMGNGLLQGYSLIYCSEYPTEWYRDIRFTLGIFLFVLGMGINIHSDYILFQLRKPGEVTYKIPRGGLFKYISGANFLGETVEWFGFAVASWSLSAFAFAFFTLCYLGLRAFHHHRFYLKKFENYPKSRKAFIPLIF